MKKYLHIGFAVETPQGLVVPVVRNVDEKSVTQLAQEIAALSKKARESALTASEMSGGCFTLSSLGGIGGLAFTPIINAPEVAILGISTACWQPVWDNREFIPRLLLPLSLSYDHRVIDGALAARFSVYLTGLLADIRRLLL
ncbi:Dihydrolipoyllysine-residue acetyltransferase component of pyruvate dehydrogenase complex [compost metagenome]